MVHAILLHNGPRGTRNSDSEPKSSCVNKLGSLGRCASRTRVFRKKRKGPLARLIRRPGQFRYFYRSGRRRHHRLIGRSGGRMSGEMAISNWSGVHSFLRFQVVDLLASTPSGNTPLILDLPEAYSRW